LYEEGCDKSDDEEANDILTELNLEPVEDSKEFTIWEINDIEGLMLIDELEAMKGTLEQFKDLKSKELKSHEELIQFFDERMLRIQNSKEEKSKKLTRLVEDMTDDLTVKLAKMSDEVKVLDDKIVKLMVPMLQYIQSVPIDELSSMAQGVLKGKFKTIGHIVIKAMSAINDAMIDRNECNFVKNVTPLFIKKAGKSFQGIILQHDFQF